MDTFKAYSDVLGAFVELPREPQRIVSLAPAITETLYMLGLGDRVVGVSPFCFKPPEAREKPKVGSYMRVNYKLLEQLHPDLVLTTTGAQLGVTRELAEKGYRVYPFPLPTTLPGVMDMVLNIARIVGASEEGYRLVGDMLGKLASLPPREPQTGYYEIDLGGPVSVGRFSYITHALLHAGVRNLYHEEPQAYIQPQPSELDREEVEVIVYETSYGKKTTPEKVAEMLRERGVEKPRALREGRIIVLPPDTLAHYGPSIVDAVEKLRTELDKLGLP